MGILTDLLEEFTTERDKAQAKLDDALDKEARYHEAAQLRDYQQQVSTTLEAYARKYGRGGHNVADQNADIVHRAAQKVYSAIEKHQSHNVYDVQYYRERVDIYNHLIELTQKRIDEMNPSTEG